jgi:hypothetical protein
VQTYGWCHNGYHDLPPGEVVRRTRLARLDGLIIKYGDPQFERAVASSGISWGIERFAYAAQAEREGNMLADAVAAGAAFAVANCEPNDGGGWDAPDAGVAIRTLIDAFRARHHDTPLWICADLRRGRSLGAPFVREAATGGIAGWMPMVYPRAFGQAVAAAYDAAFPGATYLGLPCAPVLQAYDAVGAAFVREQVTEARRRGALSLSLYLVETASDDELRAFAEAVAASPASDALPPVPRPALPPPDAATLRDVAGAYQRGAIAILDHGTPSELAAWGRLFSGNS